MTPTSTGGNSMNDAQFEQRFNVLVKANPRLNDAIETNNMNHIASNLLLKLRNQREYRIMINGISKQLESLIAGTITNAAYESNVRAIVNTYVEKSHQAM
jgi:hypothetical protein